MICHGLDFFLDNFACRLLFLYFHVNRSSLLGRINTYIDYIVGGLNFIWLNNLFFWFHHARQRVSINNFNIRVEHNLIYLRVVVLEASKTKL